VRESPHGAQVGQDRSGKRRRRSGATSGSRLDAAVEAVWHPEKARRSLRCLERSAGRTPLPRRLEPAGGPGM